MKMKNVAKAEHEVAYQDLVALVAKHSKAMSPSEILAVAANMVGKLVAMQDQRTMTTDLAMEIVVQNIEAGNQQVLDELSTSSKGAA